LETGDENQVSPLQCTCEQMLIGVCDALADRLINNNEKLFLKKFV